MQYRSLVRSCKWNLHGMVTLVRLYLWPPPPFIQLTDFLSFYCKTVYFVTLCKERVDLLLDLPNYVDDALCNLVAIMQQKLTSILWKWEKHLHPIHFSEGLLQ